MSKETISPYDLSQVGKERRKKEVKAKKPREINPYVLSGRKRAGAEKEISKRKNS